MKSVVSIVIDDGGRADSVSPDANTKASGVCALAELIQVRLRGDGRIIIQFGLGLSNIWQHDLKEPCY